MVGLHRRARLCDAERSLSKVSWLDEHHKSKQYNDSPMPYAIFFNEGKAIHAFYGSVGGLHRTAACGSQPATPKRCFVWWRSKA